MICRSHKPVLYLQWNTENISNKNLEFDGSNKSHEGWDGKTGKVSATAKEQLEGHVATN